MQVNQQISSCPLPATDNQNIDLIQYLGKWVVLYFYPKDATPGCTLESQQFRDAYNQFININAIILGVSRDSIPSHEKFKQKEQLPFSLLSDSNEILCEQFGVMKIKNLYGKSVRGIERSTFIIDPTGQIQHEWRKVKVAGHAQDVYNNLLALQKSHT